MKALPSSATFGLLAVPSTALCDDHNHDAQPTILKDESYEEQNSARRGADAYGRSVCVRCVARILILAVSFIAAAVASACAYHRPAVTVHLTKIGGNTQ